MESTDCLGVCKPGHVMGIADESTGVMIFNEMDDAASVRDLARTLIEVAERGELNLSDGLRRKMEGSLPYNAIHDLPWQR